jgi:hypothetical protein
MSVSNGINPSFPGNVKALVYSGPIGVEGSFGGTLQYKGVGTNVSTPVDVFGTTVGFSGSLLAARVLSASDTNATVDIVGNDGTICRIIKGSIGATTGCFIRINGVAGTAFTANGSIKASINSATAANNVFVELIFTSKEVEG